MLLAILLAGIPVVKAQLPPWPVGDCQNDDTSLIQHQLDDACVSKRPVHLPVTSSCFKLTAPLSLACAVELRGAGRYATAFGKAYDGPTLIVQSTTGWRPPFTTQLLAGDGGAWDGTGNPHSLDLSEANAGIHLDGLPAFTVEATVELLTVDGATEVVSTSALRPPFTNQSFGIGAYELDFYAGAPRCFLTVGGTIHLLTGQPVALGRATHVACDYDGSTIRLFVGGVEEVSTPASGTLTSTSRETECFGPCPSQQLFFPNGYIDGFSLSNVARYTESFTPPSSKPVPDGHTLALLNFIASPVAGTIEGYDANNGLNMFLPYETGAQVGGVTVADLDLDSSLQLGGGPGLWAAWAFNSHFDDLSDTGANGGSDDCIDLYDNDFQSELSHLFLYCSAKYVGQFAQAITLGNQSSGVSVSDAEVDGAALTIGLLTTSVGHGDSVKLVDRGRLVYPFVLGGGFTLTSPFVDSEVLGSQECAVYGVAGAWAQNTVVGGELDMDAADASATHICPNGGTINVLGTALGGNVK